MKQTCLPLDWDQAMYLLANEEDPRDRIFLACGFYLGLRISDLIKLTWGKLHQNEIVVQETKNKQRPKAYFA